MDINAIGMPTNRPAPVPPSAAESPETKAVTTRDTTTVNSSKSTLPDGVGTRVDKTA
jgi:hypothetical protein